MLSATNNVACQAQKMKFHNMQSFPKQLERGTKTQIVFKKKKDPDICQRENKMDGSMEKENIQDFIYPERTSSVFTLKNFPITLHSISANPPCSV